MAISVEELQGSGKSSHSYDNANADVRIFLCAWASRFDVADSLAGTEHPTLPYCYVHTITAEPFSSDLCPTTGATSDPAAQAVQYIQNGGKVALLRVTYATDFKLAPWPCQVTKPSIAENTALGLRIRGSGQFLTIPASALRWNDNSAGDPTGQMPAPDTDGRILIPIREFHLDWDYISEPPVDEWDALIGCVNNAEFLSCPAETLLFENYELEPATKFKPSEPFGWRLSAVLRKRMARGYEVGVGDVLVGWNHDFRHGGWEKILIDMGVGPEPRYELKDFSTMFTEADCGEEGV